MRVVVHIVVCALLTILVGALWRLTPFEVVAPDVALIFAVYLGVSGRSGIFEATAGVLAIGLIHDVVVGAPRGLGSLVLGTMCILARVVTGRLLVRGFGFVAVVAFVAAVAASVLTLLVEVAFDAPVAPFRAEWLAVGGSAILTALVAPAGFRIGRAVDARFARTEREREALREGTLT
jgi:rod shape-determining protein MreD